MLTDAVKMDMRITSTKWDRRNQVPIHRGWLRDTMEINNIRNLLTVPDG